MEPARGAFSVDLTPDGSRLRVVIFGDVDVASAHRPYEAVVAAFDADAGLTDVVLDMLGVSFLDSTGLGTLVRIQQLAAGRGGGVTLTGLAPKYRQLLAMTGLDQDLLIVDR